MRPSTLETGLKGSLEAVAMIVPPPPVDFFSSPLTTSAPDAPEITLGLRDARDGPDIVEEDVR